MRKYLFGLFCCLLGLVPFISYTQLSFSYTAEIYSRNVDGLGMFQLQNMTGQPVKGSVVIVAKEMRSGVTVLTLITPESIFNQGVNSFPKLLFSKSRLDFSNNTLGALVSQTRNFPPGDYDFCFLFVSSDKQLNGDFENCFEATVEPLMPVNLVFPLDEDTICNKRPLLSWQPPLPFHASTRFRLILTEKTVESAAESLIRNLPLLKLDNINSTSIHYPSTHPELKEGKTYCWQVAAIEKGILTSKSEIWEFTVQCKEPSAAIPLDSYRELKLLANGNYYIANGYLKFSFQNNYNVSKLKVEILDIQQGNKPVKHVPEIAVQHGLNKIDLDLTELGLTTGKHYTLKVYPFNELPIVIRFIYKD